jgi:general secretion pathway protein I
LSRISRSRPNAGFTLIEALIALAIVTMTLSAIGGVIAASVRGTRAIEQRLALAGTADTLFAALPDRRSLAPGSQTGELAGHFWRIDAVPLDAASPDAPQPGAASRWMPLAINVRVRSPDGSSIVITTVRLAQRPPG